MAKLSFKPIALPKPGPLYAITSDDTGVWVGGEGWGTACLFSSTDGERFTRCKTPSVWNSIGGGLLPTRDGELLFAGWYGIARSKSKRTTWPKNAAADKTWALLRAADNTIWGGGEEEVWVSTNEGKAWKRAGKTKTPIYALVETPTGIVGLGEAVSTISKSGVKARAKLPGTVRAAARSPDGYYIAVGLEGLVLRSSDGLAWKRVKCPTKEDLFGLAWCGDRFLFGGMNKAFFSITDGAPRKEKFVAGKRLDIEAIGVFRDRILICTMPEPELGGDTDGAVLLTSGKAVASAPKFVPAPFLRAPRGERAKAALDRYQQFLDALWKSDRVSSDERSWRSSNEVAFTPRMKEADLARAEKRLGIEFPPSYRSFVLEHGRFSFGKGSNESRLLAPSDMHRLDGWIAREWGQDLVDDVGVKPANVKYLRDTIPFSNGDHGLQIIWFYGFRVDAKRADGEYPIVPFDQDEIPVYAAPAKSVAIAQTFDEHVSKLVTERIESLLEEYGE